MTVPPADLRPGDRIVSVNGVQQRGELVVRIDKVTAGYVRIVTSHNGAEYYRMAHPSHAVIIERKG